MATAWASFTSRFMLEVPRCSTPLAEQAVRDAAIEFCRKTRVLKQDHTPIDSVAGTAEYSWAPGANLKVVRAEEVWYDSSKIEASSEEVVSAIYNNWPTEQDVPLYYLQERVEKLILVPKPITSVVGGIVAKVSVRPSLSAIDIDDAIYDKYVEEIVWGAKARLFAMRGQFWADPEHAAYNSQQFESCIARVAVLVDKGHTKMPLRTRTVHGIE